MCFSFNDFGLFCAGVLVGVLLAMVHVGVVYECSRCNERQGVEQPVKQIKKGLEHKGRNTYRTVQ